MDTTRRSTAFEDHIYSLLQQQIALGGQVKTGQSWTSENRPPRAWRPRRVDVYLRRFVTRKSSLRGSSARERAP